MNMSQTPEKKKARLHYDNVFKTAWADEFHFIKHSRKGNKFAFCEFCRTDFMYHVFNLLAGIHLQTISPTIYWQAYTYKLYPL